MAQNNRMRRDRYRKLFRDNPSKADLFADELGGDENLERQHKLARQGKPSNYFLIRVENFFDAPAGFLRP